MSETSERSEFIVEGHRCARGFKGVVVFMDELEQALGWSPGVILRGVEGEALATAVKRAGSPRSLASLRKTNLFARVSRGPDWEADRISTSYESAVAALARLDKTALARAMLKARRSGVALDVLEPLAERYVDAESR